MTTRDLAIFSLSGLAVWAALTLFYGAFGGPLLETAFWFYVLNAMVAASATALVFRAMVRLRRTPQIRWGYAAAAFVLPGMTAQLGVFAEFQSLFPHARPESLGRYGAFMLFAYAIVFASALQKSSPRQRA